MVTSQTLFEFSITTKGGTHNAKINLSIPHTYTCDHLAFRILQLHDLPEYIYPDLKTQLENFISSKNNEFYQKQDKAFLNEAKKTYDINAVADSWASKFMQVSDRDSGSPAKCKDDWAYTYHSLVHSCAVDQLIPLEHSYADVLSTVVKQKESELQELLDRQSVEMQELVGKVSLGQASDASVNDLASRHLEDAQLAEVRWNSTASALRDQQKRDYRDRLAELAQGQDIRTPATPSSAASADGQGKVGRRRSDGAFPFESPVCAGHSGEDGAVPADSDAVTSKEESFTIHLGTQMKQMHNLRLISADINTLLRYRSKNDSEVLPQRIQTAMHLFSHNLTGLVLLVNDRVNSYTGIKKEFGRACSMSAELHFAELEDQLESIREVVPKVVKWRKDHPQPTYESSEEKQPSSQFLSSGDFYVTKHSNVPDTHVVFHLVVGESLTSTDINSRHSAIVGLRNILKVACLNDVTTLTVPLLLTHTLSEEMTISWCQRRAELVFKCLKGFMIEMASWGGADLKNLQFLLPEGISDELFNSLGALLQSIFRLSNPLIVKTQ